MQESGSCPRRKRAGRRHRPSRPPSPAPASDGTRRDAGLVRRQPGDSRQVREGRLMAEGDSVSEAKAVDYNPFAGPRSSAPYRPPSPSARSGRRPPGPARPRSPSTSPSRSEMRGSPRSGGAQSVARRPRAPPRVAARHVHAGRDDLVVLEQTRRSRLEVVDLSAQEAEDARDAGTGACWPARSRRPSTSRRTPRAGGASARGARRSTSSS